MKKLYTTLYSLLAVFMIWAQTARAQTPCDRNIPSGTVAYDTTVRFPSGVTHKQIKFPKFNAQTGMLSCVKLIITTIGVVDTSAIENLVDAKVTITRNYTRADTMIGPGLTPALYTSYTGSTSIPLEPNDNVDNSGTDFYSNARDTVLKQQMTRTLTDSTSISAFYGTDSVVYDYYMKAKFDLSSSDVANYVRSSAAVNIRLEYCTCPMTVLPVGLKNFSVTKTASGRADLRWEAEAGADHYFYQIEVSRDGARFEKVSTLNKQADNPSPSYQYGYAVKPTEGGRYYFRIRQQWLDGYYRYSEVRSVDFADPLFAAVSLYPNPTSGQAGIKFVAAKAGVYKVEVTNTAGQTVSNKEMRVAETDFKQLNALQKGTYYVKITELASSASCTQRLVVQ